MTRFCDHAEVNVLGFLGDRFWVRCRYCGADLEGDPGMFDIDEEE
jgi:hypothetical protein